MVENDAVVSIDARLRDDTAPVAVLAGPGCRERSGSCAEGTAKSV
jgi:hypothetical protein